MHRSARWIPVTGLVLVAAIAAGIAGCGGSCGGILASGRAVIATSDTLSTSATFAADTAQLQLGSLTVDVQPTQVVVDGRPVADLDAQAKKVLVTRADGQLTIVADGATVYNAPIRK